MPLKKMQKRVEELGDKCKEVMGEPSTNPLAPQNGSAPDDQQGSRSLRNLGETSVKPFWDLGEPSTEPLKTEPFGSPRQRVRKQFCPETFTIAEDPKVIAVGELDAYLVSKLIIYVHISTLAVNILLPNWLLL